MPLLPGTLFCLLSLCNASDKPVTDEYIYMGNCLFQVLMPVTLETSTLKCVLALNGFSVQVARHSKFCLG